jgi:hypothetical protein
MRSRWPTSWKLPANLRLDRNTYLAVQQIYDPGFTIGGGFGEGGGMIALLVQTPQDLPIQRVGLPSSIL